jgi:hypothetical protein
MAINVNTVYQTVLLILNKEQRGYMTPLEFNKTGTQAQLEIFEAYFDSLNQQIRVPQTSADYSNRIVSLEEKLSIFKEFGDATSVSASNVFNLPLPYTGNSSTLLMVTAPVLTTAGIVQYVIGNNANNNTVTAEQILSSEIQVFLNSQMVSNTDYSITGKTITFNSQPIVNQNIVVNAYPKQFYKLGQVLYDAGGATIPRELQEVGRDELYHLLSSDLTLPNVNNPIYLYERNQLTIYPTTIVDNIQVAYIRKPLPPIWNFTVGGSNQYVYSTSSSFDFELHPAEQTELILKILLYAGVVIQSPEIIQVAASQVQQEQTNQKS